MNPFLRFLASARSLANQGMSKEAIEQFAKNEFGKINTMMQKQINNIFKPSKPIKPKDPDFDNTVEKMVFDDEGKPFNPRNPLKKAEGGRIGYAMGSKGIMQMASVDDPFYRGGEEDEHSFRMFNKPYKELNADELEEFREEMMRLMQKFSKVDRGAPSITLADGGRAEFKDGLLARMMKGVKPDGGMFKSIFANRNAPFLSGFNTAELFDLVTQISSLPGLADGGRIEYKNGPPDPTKRKFMKAAVGIASMIPGIGMLGKGAKVAAPVVAKAAEISGPALAKIVETVMSAGKLISVTGRKVKEMVTKKKLGKVEVEEDIMDGSYIIKKDGKEINYKPGRMDETGGIEDDIIEVIDKTVKKAGGGIGYMLGE